MKKWGGIFSDWLDACAIQYCIYSLGLDLRTLIESDKIAVPPSFLNNLNDMMMVPFKVTRNIYT